jgi:hypothetical protein
MEVGKSLGWHAPRRMWSGFQPKKLWRQPNLGAMNRAAVEQHQSQIATAASTLHSAGVQMSAGLIAITFQGVQQRMAADVKARLDDAMGRFKNLKA